MRDSEVHRQLCSGLALACAALGSWAPASAAVDAVTVNGQPIRIVDQDFVIPIQYSRFTIDADVEITHSQAIDSFTISPKRRNLPATSDGNKLKFTLDGWGYWSLKINDDLFLLFADPPENNPPAADGRNVHNVVTDTLPRKKKL